MDSCTQVPRKVIRRAPIAGIDDMGKDASPIVRVVKRIVVNNGSGNNTLPVKKTSKGAVTKTKFAKPGQRYETPKETDPLYQFYFSLLKQKPDSQMAIKWCLEHGVLSSKKATSLVLSQELSVKAKIK